MFDESPPKARDRDRNGSQPTPGAITISAPIASQCIQRLIQTQLRVAGFKGANRSAMDAIEKEVVSYLNDTYEFAVALANNSGRSRPSAQDMLQACEDGTWSAGDLKRVMKKSVKLSRSHVPMFKPAPKRKRSPELLASDESSGGEDNGQDQSRTEKQKDSSNKPRTLKHLPNQLPDLPPKHSYMRTAAPNAPKPSLSVLDQQLERTMLVQESLQNIVKATGPDDSPSFKALALPEVASSLLAEVVNWETVGPQATETRKRWNV
ncbi:transcription factor TFIID complex subunit 8 carboxy-term protein [Ceratobasidium sp. AG-Ba]|nr:transcription factor TFIID complex subunit 8 carboxy-term protein [Ceratobasidium sp. AG-Ba]